MKRQPDEPRADKVIPFMPFPKVSVIIPAFNEADCIKDQLTALARQTYADPFEIIVANNGSTDATADIVCSFQIARENISIRLIDAGAKPGINFARNEGARHSNGDYLFYCDADDQVDAGWIENGVTVLKNAAFIGGLIINSRDNTVVNPHCIGVSKSGAPSVIGCNFAVRRAELYEIGGFDEGLPRYGCDDIDFSIRATRAGYPPQPAPNMIVYWQPTSAVKTISKVFLSSRAECVLWDRHPDFYGHAGSIRSELYSAVKFPVTAWHLRKRGFRPVARQGVTIIGHLAQSILRLCRLQPPPTLIGPDPRPSTAGD